MRIIKLNAIDSTNNYLRKLSFDEPLDDFTTVTAEFQTEGKGQMGNIWSSETSKNLMFSVFKKVYYVTVENSFLISIVVALSMIRTLEHFSIPKLKIKWPNDILSDGNKICGVLIENVIKQSTLNATIVGVGLNVNQKDFINLPQASSMFVLTGRLFNRDEILLRFLTYFQAYTNEVKEGSYEQFSDAYESYLFRKDKPSTFERPDGQKFTGIIQSVSKYGNLQVLLENEVIEEFEVKEIKLLY